MKINPWLAYLWLTGVYFLCADEKIYHMIYAEKQPAPFKKNKTKQNSRDLVYCIKTDNNLYVADVTGTIYYDEYKQKEIKLYTPKKSPKRVFVKNIIHKWQKDQLELVEGRLMLIGKPTIYNNVWIMPAVVKRKYFGFLQSTDLCIIAQQVIGNSVWEEKGEHWKELDDTTEYIVYKVADGHRTLANFVGLVEVSNNDKNDLFKTILDDSENQKSLLMFSSSRWPTLKIVNVNGPAKSLKHDDLYTFDMDQQGKDFFYVNAYIGNSFFAKKQLLRIVFSKNINDKTDYFQQPINDFFPHFLPKLFLSPDFIYKANIESVGSILEKIFSNEKLQSKDIRYNEKLQSKDIRYKVYITDKDEAFFVPTNQMVNKITSLLDEPLDKDESILVSPSIDKNSIITASACDFNNQRLFLGMYNKKGKTLLQYISISQQKKSEELV
ncbi:MAG TPA: hypothetical protein VL201_01325 [Patescibacteria group bacterium]|nr:hypothetical protein [Patescibacteria group bacterium]